MGQTFDRAKNEWEAKSLGKSSKTSLEFSHIALPFQREIGRESRTLLGVGDGCIERDGGPLIARGAAFGMVPAEIKRDAVKPGFEPSAALVIGQRCPGTDKSILAKFLCILPAPDPARAKAVYGGLMHLHECAESSIITGAGTGDQLRFQAGKRCGFGPLGDQVKEGLNARDR